MCCPPASTACRAGKSSCVKPDNRDLDLDYVQNVRLAPKCCSLKTWWGGVHIRFCGNGRLWFRSYSGSLWKSPKVTKGLLPLSFGASPRLGLSRGQEDQKPKPNRGGLPAGLIARLYTPPCRSWLAGDDVIPANTAAPDTPPSPASRLLQGLSTSERNWSADRPPSRASPLPQKSKGKSTYTHAPHHSSGRALARLQLLILIHPPPREAEGRCSSGDWRAAPFDAVELIACRCQRSQPEGDAPG
jgi:hypothetical protein